MNNGEMWSTDKRVHDVPLLTLQGDREPSQLSRLEKQFILVYPKQIARTLMLLKKNLDDILSTYSFKETLSSA